MIILCFCVFITSSFVIPFLSVLNFVQYLIKLGKFEKNRYCCVSSALTSDLHCHCLAGRCHCSLRFHNPCDPYLTRPSWDHCHPCTHVTGFFNLMFSLHPPQRWSSWLERMARYISLMRTCNSKAIVQVQRVIHVAEGLGLCWFVMSLYRIFCSLLCCVWTQAVLLISYKCQSNTVSACQE